MRTVELTHGCACGFPVLMFLKSEDGRLRFYLCGRLSNPCDFFSWADAIVLCRCERGPCTIYRSRTQLNHDRLFYCCPRWRMPGEDCGFLKWLDAVEGNNAVGEEDTDLQYAMALRREAERERQSGDAASAWAEVERGIENLSVNGMGPTN